MVVHKSHTAMRINFGQKRFSLQKVTSQLMEGEYQMMRKDISVRRHEAACANRGAFSNRVS